MRAVLLAALFCLASCASSSPGAGGGADASSGALSVDLFPLTASSATFALSPGKAVRTLAVAPFPDGSSARVTLEAPGTEAPAKPAGFLVVTREGGSLFFAGSPGRGTEIVRSGARPGESWESDGRTVTFDGWERVGARDAARVTTRRGPASFQEVQTWWFARDVGLVRWRFAGGGLYADEMLRTD